MKFSDSKFSNESGTEPVNLLELKSLKEKEDDYYDEFMAHGIGESQVYNITRVNIKSPIILSFLFFLSCLNRNIAEN